MTAENTEFKPASNCEHPERCKKLRGCFEAQIVAKGIIDRRV